MNDEPTSCLRWAILALTQARGPGRTICPSEAARACAASDWRELMATARAVAWTLQDEGLVTVRQRGQPVSQGQARGPIRIGLPNEGESQNDC